MQLQLNEQADVDAFTHAIRDWLQAHGGRPHPNVVRRAVSDHGDEMSLLSKPVRDLKDQAKRARQSKRTEHEARTARRRAA